MNNRILIAGGGTGGHIFPALAVAAEIKLLQPNAEFLFVGAKGKMEMEKVPKAGFTIVGLDISGFNRSNLLKNFALPLKIIKSYFHSRKILRTFKPQAAFGVGGYSTYPIISAAQSMGIPTYLHEANAYAGKSNMYLSKKAKFVFTGTQNMSDFFPKEKTIYTGNPIRKELINNTATIKEARDYFQLHGTHFTLLVVGGSLGARSINNTIQNQLQKLIDANIQIIWQTGQTFQPEITKQEKVWCSTFIDKMELAYKAADLVVCRAGAMTVAEICALCKPAIFIPLPTAAEDHQTANAQLLVTKGAAVSITDHDANNRLLPEILNFVNNQTKLEEIKENLKQFGQNNAASIIAKTILSNIHA